MCFHTGFHGRSFGLSDGSLARVEFCDAGGFANGWIISLDDFTRTSTMSVLELPTMSNRPATVTPRPSTMSVLELPTMSNRPATAMCFHAGMFRSADRWFGESRVL